jgi:two-component system, chemotaxis family, CheB/CheR fusion protein
MADVEGRRLSEALPGSEPHWWEIPARVAESGTPERHELFAGSLGRWFEVHLSRMPAKDGPPRVAILMQDITERRRSEERLREAQELLTMATNAAHLGWGTWNFKDGTATWDARGRELIGLGEDEGTAAAWLSHIHPEDRPAVEAHVAECLASGRLFDMEYRVVLADGALRSIHAAGAFQLDEAGEPKRGAGLVRDVTERRRAEESQRLLIQELNHRVKNMLAVVQSIAHQTQRTTEGVQDFVTAFEDRMQALALAHSLLTVRSWQRADLAELVQSTFATFAEPDRLDVGGPVVEMTPNATISLAMGLHELGTNAVKYGSLSRPEGRVAVTWQVGPGEAGGRGLRITWRELDGPPVAPPRREGFGTRMLERGIARELEGSVAIDYKEQGLVCSMTFPINGRFRSA